MSYKVEFGIWCKSRADPAEHVMMASTVSHLITQKHSIVKHLFKK